MGKTGSAYLWLHYSADGGRESPEGPVEGRLGSVATHCGPKDIYGSIVAGTAWEDLPEENSRDG